MQFTTSCKHDQTAARNLVSGLLIAALMSACEPAATAPTAPTAAIVPGSSKAPREVNLIARDYRFLPETLGLARGETVQLNLINAGLVTHEAVIGDEVTQDAWEAAEAAVAGAPPGPTPAVSVAPDKAGIRLVVGSGELATVVMTVPLDASRWFVSCHIPGHLEKGMQIPVRWMTP